jgi:hypothetical protein
MLTKQIEKLATEAARKGDIRLLALCNVALNVACDRASWVRACMELEEQVGGLTP